MGLIVKFYSKRDCGACALVRARLQQWQLQYQEIFDHKLDAPTIAVNNNFCRPPLTTTRLKTFLSQFFNI